MQPMKRRTFILLAALTAGAQLTTAACSENSPNRENSGPTLNDLTANVFLPGYRDLDASALTLSTATTALRDAPTAETLASAQKAWRAAKKAWHRTDAFAFGPAVDKASAAGVFYWPTNPATIEATIAGADTLDDAALARLGANAKGLAALEYVLFDSTGGDAAVLTALAGDGAPSRRRTFAALVASAVQKRTAELLNAWSPTGENFAKEVSAAGAGSAKYAAQKSAVDDIVNFMIFAAETVVRARLAKPIGKEAAGVAQPQLEESSRSDASLDDMKAALEGVESVYTGAYGGVTGNGVFALITARNPDLDTRVRAALTAAKASIAAVPPPMRTALQGDRVTLDAAYTATNALKRLLATEVASVLGSALQFGDNDGD